MKFRPCIDIHNGKVKQLIGGSLRDENDYAKENFVSGHSAAWYAEKYKADGLTGGHIIILNKKDSDYYDATKEQAMLALKTYIGGMQIGGGVDADNAGAYIGAGASHIIVTSYVFRDGKVNYDNLDKLLDAVGREKIVLDLSCRKRDGRYFIVTDRWQKFTDVELDSDSLDKLAHYCDEFLIHGVDVEGKGSGMDQELVRLLSDKVCERPDFNSITYAGGISSIEDIDRFEYYSQGKLDFTIGSALDIFGGHLNYQDIVKRWQGLKNDGGLQ